MTEKAIGTPNGIRTRVTGVKGQRPRPLDDGSLSDNPRGCLGGSRLRWTEPIRRCIVSAKVGRQACLSLGRRFVKLVTGRPVGQPQKVGRLRALAIGVTVVSAAIASMPASAMSRSVDASSRGSFSLSSVRDGRFVRTVTFDDGLLTVTPAPPAKKPMRDSAEMQRQAWATVHVGEGRHQIFGFGIVTITKVVAGIPTVKELPAWVGVSTQPIAYLCPLQHAPSDGSWASTPGFSAVVIGDGFRSPAVVYHARNEICGTKVPASVEIAYDVVSAPWHLVTRWPAPSLKVSGPMVPLCAGSTKSAVTIGSQAVTLIEYAVVPEWTPYVCDPVPLFDTVAVGPVGPGVKLIHGPVGPLRAGSVP